MTPLSGYRWKIYGEFCMNKNLLESVAMGIKAYVDIIGQIRLSYSGRSMEPTIPSKAEICVEKFCKISPGNIYVFYFVFPMGPAQLVCHRLIYELNGKCYFRGDNRSHVEVVDESNIIGHVRSWSE